MGNHLACVSIQNCDVVQVAKKTNFIFVVHSGEIRVLEFSGPTVQVAELMLEFQGFFITELAYSNSASTTATALPMTADKELMSFSSKKPGVGFVLLPMNRLQKQVQAHERALWAQLIIKQLSVSVVKQQKSTRSRRASKKVAPVDLQEDAVQNANINNVEQLVINEEEESTGAADVHIQLLKEELSSISSSYCRKHWNPKLETIIEV